MPALQQFVTAFAEIRPIVAAAVTVALAVAASAHVVLYKRDSRAAVAWVGLIWLVPVLGAVLYLLFGINRVRRRAALRRGERWTGITLEFERPATLRSEKFLPSDLYRLHSLAELVDRVTGRPVTAGNAVTPLENGDAAYPDMLAAIEGSQRSVGLCTYIFGHDHAGQSFVDALSNAARRGVAVRVLIDDVGARYSWPPIVHRLRTQGVTVARFGRTLLPWRLPYMNLRNHRKLLVVDGRIGFTGGMNIRDGHLLAITAAQASLSASSGPEKDIQSGFADMGFPWMGLTLIFLFLSFVFCSSDQKKSLPLSLKDKPKTQRRRRRNPFPLPFLFQC